MYLVHIPFIDAEVKLFEYVVLGAILAGVCLGLKLSRRRIFGYLQQGNQAVRVPLFFTHVLGALLPALFLPNNLLTKYATIRGVFNESELYIPLSMFLLFVALLIVLGLLLTGLIDFMYPKRKL